MIAVKYRTWTYDQTFNILSTCFNVGEHTASVLSRQARAFRCYGVAMIATNPMDLVLHMTSHSSMLCVISDLSSSLSCCQIRVKNRVPTRMAVENQER